MKKLFCQAKYVEWIDSTMKPQVWWDVEELIKEVSEQKSVFKTIAYLAYETKDEYIFANSIHNNDGVVVSFGQIFSIPKGCVLKIKNVSINK